MEDIAKLLKRDTGFDWCEASNLYVDYRSKYAPFGQFCVFTPDDYIRKGKFSRFYLPNNGTRLHDPDWFVKHYLNTKKQLVKTMPWIKLDLDQLPKKIYYGALPDGSIISGSFSLEGDIKLRPAGSTNQTTIGSETLKNISANAIMQTRQFLKTELKENLNLETGKLTVGITSVNGEWSNSIILDPPIIKAEVTPPIIHTFSNGWEIELQTTIVFQGSITKTPPYPTPIKSDFWEYTETIGAGLILATGLVLLVIFTGGMGGVAILA